MDSESTGPKTPGQEEASPKPKRPSVVKPFKGTPPPTKTRWISTDSSTVKPPPMQLLLVEWTETDEEETDTKISIGYVTRRGVWVTSHGDAIETGEGDKVTNWAYVSLSDGTFVELE